MTNQDNNVEMTNKLPALVVGILLFVAGLFVSQSKLKNAALIAFLLFCAAGGFVGWSLTIKDWCSVRNIQQSAFSSAFAPSFHQCIKLKGWFEL